MSREVEVLGALIVLGLATAPQVRAAEPIPEESPCPSWSGFLWVGTLWEYGIHSVFFDGLVRVELMSIDTDTGEVVTATTARIATDAYIYNVERSDTYLCNEIGLYHLGWTSAWELTNEFGEFEVTGTLVGTWTEGESLLFRVLGGIWGGPLELTTTDGDGLRMESDAFRARRWAGDPEEIVVLGETVKAVPVENIQTGRITWWAEEIGQVQHEGMVLESYTPGSGTP